MEFFKKNKNSMTINATDINIGIMKTTYLFPEIVSHQNLLSLNLSLKTTDAEAINENDN